MVDANHLVGDYYWVDPYPPSYWFIVAGLCLGLPPLGVFLLAWMVGECITGADEDIPAELRE
jgi:hypothetical protein